MRLRLFAVLLTVAAVLAVASSAAAAAGDRVRVTEAQAAFPDRAYVVSLPTRVQLGRNQVRVFENGKPLGPSHSPHSVIRERGNGRYSHWGNAIIFSASDGSDPRTNGRVYSIASPTTTGRPNVWSPNSTLQTMFRPVVVSQSTGGLPV